MSDTRTAPARQRYVVFYTVFYITERPSEASFASPEKARTYCDGLSSPAYVWDYEASTVVHRNFLDTPPHHVTRGEETMNKLREDANYSAEHRGHNLVWEEPHHMEARSLQSATCKHCPAWVQINTQPLPNEIDIGGPAVAVGCPADHEAIC